MNNYLFLLLGLLFLGGCVPKSKFDSLLLQNGKTQLQRDSLLPLANSVPALNTQLRAMREQLQGTQEHFNDTQIKYTALKDNFTDVEKRHDELLKQNKILLENSSQQVQLLNDQLSKKESELDKREQELKRMETNLKEKENVLKEVNNNYSEYEQKIKNLETSIAQNKAQLEALKTNVIKALTGFQATDLSVTERDGKIYVSLSQDLLFASGSDQIDSKGKDAIQKLAQVLKGNKDFLIEVEGHTDATGTVDKNWDLSVRRATSVVKILSGAGVDPKIITASGRALYNPIAENESVEGRAKNRRTEIILAPRLNELYQLVRQ